MAHFYLDEFLCTVVHISWSLLQRQKRIVISVIKTNTIDDIKKIVYFGILIHVLS